MSFDVKPAKLTNRISWSNIKGDGTKTFDLELRRLTSSWLQMLSFKKSNVKFQESYVKFQESNVKFQESNVKFQESNIKFQEPNVKFLEIEC